MLDNFDDNSFTGRVEAKGSVIESNQQFNVFGSFPLPTHSMYNSYVIAGYPTTWTVADGTTLEWRADLISLDENATNTAILTVGSDTGGGYIFHKGRQFPFLLKWSASGSYCFLSCERAALRNTNVVLALALTRVPPNLVLTTRVLDKADPNAVLYQHSVVDTPNADPTLIASQFQALTGIQLVDLSADAPGAPPVTDAAWLGVFQHTNGKQPVPRATFDNLELWTYKVPTTRYVDAASANPTPPYTNWLTAATNIQDAVDAALAGDEIVVTNGVYATGGRAVGTNIIVNRVAVDKPLSLRSVNGPEFTIIQGYQVPGTTNGDGAIRCVYLASGASLSGFTLTNGATKVWASGTADSAYDGGGLWCESTNAAVSNCVVAGNSAGNQGGGAFGGTLNNCVLTGNSARINGGGASDSALNYCTLSNNSAELQGGGAKNSTLNHCLLTGNSVTDNSGVLGFAGGANGGTLNNCILYFNTARTGANYFNGAVFFNPPVMNYCCTTPMPTNGVGNITNAPRFVDYAAGNLRLQSNSPCINAGRNAYAPGLTDLDGLPRIVSGTVDLGAYEYQGAGSLISYAWLEQYNLPTDGSADATDPDADGHTTWQEWRCLTDPTNALSALRLLSATPDGTNVTVSWQSVAGVSYFLERCTNLSAAPPFTLLAPNLPGQPGMTSFTDSNAAPLTPLFYRIGVYE